MLRAELRIGRAGHARVRVPEILRHLLDRNARLDHESACGSAQIMWRAMLNAGAATTEAGISSDQRARDVRPADGPEQRRNAIMAAAAEGREIVPARLESVRAPGTAKSETAGISPCRSTSR